MSWDKNAELVERLFVQCSTASNFSERVAARKALAEALRCKVCGGSGLIHVEAGDAIWGEPCGACSPSSTAAVDGRAGTPKEAFTETQPQEKKGK